MMQVVVSDGRSGWQGTIAGEREAKKAPRKKMADKKETPVVVLGAGNGKRGRRA